MVTNGNGTSKSTFSLVLDKANSGKGDGNSLKNPHTEPLSERRSFGNSK
jgi:hypothetical protein